MTPVAALPLLLALTLAAPQAAAQAPDLPATPEQRQAEPGTETPEARGPGLMDRATLLGDLGGLRPRLAAAGVTVNLSEASEVFGAPASARRRAVTYAGLTRFGLQLDTEPALGLKGGTFRASGFQIHGQGLGANALRGDVIAPSNIEERRGTLLAELWYEQVVAPGIAIRAGQMFADLEFMTSEYGGLFLASTFGWTAFGTAALPNGGPIYPRAALGIRAKAQLSDNWTLLAAAFNADPTGPDRADGRPANPSGTALRLGDGVFAITEVQYALNPGDSPTALPGTYKFGGWYNSKRFEDRRDPSVDRRGNWSLYATADQLVLREPGTKDQGLGLFARLMGGPSDRNLLDFYAEGGLTYKGLIPGRTTDTAGLALAHTRFSDRRGRADPGTPPPNRRTETFAELTYQATITPWWQLQPTIQYVFNPGADRTATGRRAPDTLILALRTNLTF